MLSRIIFSFKTNSKIVLFSKTSIQQLTKLFVVSMSFSKLSFRKSFVSKRFLCSAYSALLWEFLFDSCVKFVGSKFPLRLVALFPAVLEEFSKECRISLVTMSLIPFILMWSRNFSKVSGFFLYKYLTIYVIGIFNFLFL